MDSAADINELIKSKGCEKQPGEQILFTCYVRSILNFQFYFVVLSKYASERVKLLRKKQVISVDCAKKMCFYIG